MSTMGLEGFGSPVGHADSDLQVRVYYLTHLGVPQQAIISSTQSQGSFAPKAELLREAVEAYFRVMGGTVLSVQLEIVSPSRFSPELTRQAKVLAFPDRRHEVRREADRDAQEDRQAGGGGGSAAGLAGLGWIGLDGAPLVAAEQLAQCCLCWIGWAA